jgi:hypothetical protein
VIKNTASQKVGVQMVSAVDGTAFTGSVTVSVTGDAGTQATGSVGSGACTHEGNGYHTYAPAQAETNYDLIAFTFIGSGAVPQTVQVYTRAAAPDVNVASIAANAITDTAIASNAITDAKVASDVTIASVTGAVGSVTGNVGGNVAGSVASVTAGVTLAASAIQAIWDAATSALSTASSIGKLLVDNINATISSRLASASYTAPLDAAGTRTALGLGSANLDTQIGDLPTNAELATALGTADDAVLAAIAALNNLSAAGAQSAAAAALTAYTAATAAQVAAVQTAVLAKLPSALSSNGNIKADVQEINATDITGDGSLGNPWGPA